MKALVVDDSKTMRMILKKALGQLGFDQFLEAGDGIEALKVLLKEEALPELALFDWNMPNMNGIDLLERVRKNKAWAEMKVVMVTTEAELGHIQRALGAGADEYVMKPFTPEILSDKLSMIGIGP